MKLIFIFSSSLWKKMENKQIYRNVSLNLFNRNLRGSATPPWGTPHVIKEDLFNFTSSNFSSQTLWFEVELCLCYNSDCTKLSKHFELLVLFWKKVFRCSVSVRYFMERYFVLFIFLEVFCSCEIIKFWFLLWIFFDFVVKWWFVLWDHTLNL